MNMLVKSAETGCRGPLSKSGVKQPPIRAFMDDLTVPTKALPVASWILQGLEGLMTWVRMSFKPTKSQSLVMNRGKITDQFRFRLREDHICLHWQMHASGGGQPGICRPLPQHGLWNPGHSRSEQKESHQ